MPDFGDDAVISKHLTVLVNRNTVGATDLTLKFIVATREGDYFSSIFNQQTGGGGRAGESGGVWQSGYLAYSER